MNRSDSPQPGVPNAWWLRGERLLVLVVIAVAAFLRFYRLDSIPPGLRFDEAYNGLDALRILDGARPIFLPENFGREALFIYAQALSVAILGPSGLALRVVAAICGSLTFPFTYILTRRLFSRRVALLTVAWLALSLWHVIFSRIGLRTISLPLVAAAMLYCLIRGLEPLFLADERSLAGDAVSPGRVRVPWLVLTGVLLGVSLYTYTAARFLPFVVVVFTVLVALDRPGTIKNALLGVGIIGVVAVLVFTPEGLYFARHPSTFVERASQVSIFNPDVNGGSVAAALGYSIERSFGMFVVAGDANWDRNIPAQPVFGPLSALFLGIGLVRILRKPRHPPHALLLVWGLIMLVPGVLAARDVPNFLHYTGILPGLFVIPALGADALWSYWECRGPAARRLLPLLAFTASFLVGTVMVYRAYFGTWAHSPDVAFLFDADRYLTLETGRSIAIETNAPIDVAAGDSTTPLASYLLARLPSSISIQTFDGSRSLIFPSTNRPVTYLLSSADFPPSSLIQRFFSQTSRFVVRSTLAGSPVTRLQLSESPPDLVPPTPLPARFGESVEVLGFDVPRDVRAGQSLTVRWYWRIRSPDSRDLTFTNQVFDSANHRLGILDDRAFVPGYWPSGTEGISTFEVPIDPFATTGPVWVRAAIYDRATLGHLAIFDLHGRPAGDFLKLGPIKVHGKPTPPPTVSHPLLTHFDDNIDLLGYDIAPNSASVQLILYWSARARPSENYTVFVHALGNDGRLVGQADSPPQDGDYPTGVWDASETIVDRHVIRVDSAKVDAFALGLYAPATGKRLPIMAGQVGGDTVTLPNRP